MEERVKRVLTQPSLQIARGVLTDQDVAEQLRLDMQKRARRVREEGVLAYRQPIAPTQNINKGFLLNTIKSVDTHNQRQEVDACYRKRQLEKRLDTDSRSHRRHDTRKRARSHERPSPRRIQESPPSRPSQDHDDEREFWASRKAQKTQAILDKVGDRVCSLENAPAYDDSSNSSSDEKADKKQKKLAKKAKKAKKKLKKQQKKQKQRDDD